MRKAAVRLLTLAGAALTALSAQAQQPVKLGVILPYSGQFADGATQLDNGTHERPAYPLTARSSRAVFTARL